MIKKGKKLKKKKLFEKGKKNWKLLILCLISVYLVAFVGSVFTSSSVNSDWYKAVKPSITPLDWVFPVVWNVLFFLIALSMYFALVNTNKYGKIKVGFVFGINFLLNILWTFLYFKLQSPFLSFFEIILLWFSILAMMIVTYRISKKSCYLLLPYLLWVSFAVALNYLSV